MNWNILNSISMVVTYVISIFNTQQLLQKCTEWILVSCTRIFKKQRNQYRQGGNSEMIWYSQYSVSSVLRLHQIS